MKIPKDLLYTEDHEWIKVNGTEATIGITDFAQKELGDIVFVEVETIDETIAKGDAFGTIEAVKTVSDMFMPVSGTVIELNEMLDSEPEVINKDPYGNGWIVKIKMSDTKELNDLLDAEAYQASIEA
ncbi:MAG TPA: glycine cleavage system protein GcvH [Bacteroidales bacterium]